MAMLQYQHVSDAIRIVLTDVVEHRCRACRRKLGVEEVPEAGCTPRPIYIKCECNTLNRVWVGKVRH